MRRNNKMIKSAVQSSAIVASIFPSNVRDRLYKEQEEVENRRKQQGNLTSYLIDGNVGASVANDTPLADFFTETTVLVRTERHKYTRSLWGHFICIALTKKLYLLFTSLFLQSSLILPALQLGALCDNPVKYLFCSKHCTAPSIQLQSVAGSSRSKR